jgi:nucleoside triphosphate diphosphatase
MKRVKVFRGPLVRLRPVFLRLPSARTAARLRHFPPTLVATLKPSRDIARLIEIMATLRTPQTGCPWDLEQTFASIAPYTIEEAYEVADAITRGDIGDLREELGDLLLQVVFHARMAEEQSAFDFGDVVQAICEKLLRRHPHVFGDARHLTPDAVKGAWDRIKTEEKAERAARRGTPLEAGALAGIPAGLSALARALKLQDKAGKVGFDWNDPLAVLAKIREETEEIAQEIEDGEPVRAGAEVGDLLFAVATNLKFERRFSFIERTLAERGKRPEQSTLDEMDALWNAAKATERTEE